ncbi:LuxR family two component transcriptional regulator [Clostridium pasteurianum DSM 525 = ATCC 6013]|uniref:Stage 0 sporulation protein A homolog n=1 Tax=Clostridium pasteurianum DSM 525 = ATCC 6013 TaxID=1262449 RepID=A0A0H3J4Z2_CLOPA|nr:response regulator transcription factor [Clostridium pasteurianum]AJA48991.1 LuxR family two component transcriptional regulator [Clostridium pasteurianum DSM 525 = ATCC 6013]AJA52979.1 LuxR family two component transcriptional regulator [Clostridium pasteurianum DSM 525 = ATCC 6013]AOZ76198.1 LuxR family transcriptional regulator [Clostridium pasteurianum DSM 525 = ATCC 6013]AOZ79994.1 LuxR family transcriptional regulator [Clostridium pasteurianum]ELP60287.1 LuxR family two component tran
MSIKLIIADDDAIVREGFKMILSMDKDYEILYCAENGEEAAKYCIKNKVDVALLDVRMPVKNGVEATREICGNTDTKVLILTTFDDDEFIKDAIKNGAKGYLLKSNTPERIKDAIRMVQGGHTVIQDIIFDKIKEEIGNSKENKLNKTLFSKREIEIIESISRGLSNKEIAKELYISEGTVANYITSILNKTGLEHRTQIAIYYLT